MVRVAAIWFAGRLGQGQMLRLLQMIVGTVPMLALAAFAIKAQLHQNELLQVTTDFAAQAGHRGAKTDMFKDPAFREAYRKVCGDAVVGTAMTGHPDPSCLRLLENTAN